jgi:hypothetical protein
MHTDRFSPRRCRTGPLSFFQFRCGEEDNYQNESDNADHMVRPAQLSVAAERLIGNRA